MGGVAFAFNGQEGGCGANNLFEDDFDVGFFIELLQEVFDGDDLQVENSNVDSNLSGKDSGNDN